MQSKFTRYTTAYKLMIRIILKLLKNCRLKLFIAKILKKVTVQNNQKSNRSILRRKYCGTYFQTSHFSPNRFIPNSGTHIFTILRIPGHGCEGLTFGHCCPKEFSFPRHCPRRARFLEYTLHAKPCTTITPGQKGKDEPWPCHIAVIFSTWMLLLLLLYHHS